jgi:hypothetical protein
MASMRRFVPADDPGVVDEPGERAEHAIGLGEQAQDVVFVADSRPAPRTRRRPRP